MDVLEIYEEKLETLEAEEDIRAILNAHSTDLKARYEELQPLTFNKLKKDRVMKKRREWKRESESMGLSGMGLLKEK